MMAFTVAPRFMRGSARMLAKKPLRHNALVATQRYYSTDDSIDPREVQKAYRAQREELTDTKTISDTLDLLEIVQAMESDEPEKKTKRKQAGGNTPTEKKRRPVVYRSLDFWEDQDEGPFPTYARWRMTDKAKMNLYEDYKSDPTKWTVKALSEKYLITPERVPAVIDLMESREEYDRRCKEEPDKYKAFWNLEDMEDRKLYDLANLVTGMDIGDTSETGVPEPIIVAMTGNSDTKFRVVNDEDLNKFYDRLTEEAKKEVPLRNRPVIPTTPPTILEEQPTLKSGTKFVVTDISRGAKEKARTITIREPDGTLRTPTGSERFQIEKRQFPSKRNVRLL